MYGADDAIIADCRPQTARIARVATWMLSIAAAGLLVACAAGATPTHFTSILLAVATVTGASASFMRSTMDGYFRVQGKSSLCRITATTTEKLPKCRWAVVTLASLAGDLMFIPMCIAASSGSASGGGVSDAFVPIMDFFTHPGKSQDPSLASNLDFYLRVVVSGVVLTSAAVRNCITMGGGVGDGFSFFDRGAMFDAAAAFLRVLLLTNLLSALPCRGDQLLYNSRVACGSGAHSAGVFLSLSCVALAGLGSDVAIEKGWLLVDDSDLPRTSTPRIDKLHLYSGHFVRLVAAACANAGNGAGEDVSVFMLLVVALLHHLALIRTHLPSTMELLNKAMLASAVLNAALLPIGIILLVLGSGDGEQSSTYFAGVYLALYGFGIIAASVLLFRASKGLSLLEPEEVFVDAVTVTF